MKLKIGISLIFGLTVILLSVSSLQFTLAFETEQEPKPPEIPGPTPEPEPIRSTDPDPVPEPFPGDTESEKIQQLTEENDKLKQQNTNLQEQITAGKHPVAQAAASLYISCIMNGEKISQKKFSIESGVSDVTIRNRAALIKKTLKLGE